MNEEFIKEHGNMFANDLNDEQVMIVVNFIIKLEQNDGCKRLLIQQFLLNWVDVESISLK